MSLHPQDLYGAWALEEWYVENADGSRTAPFGTDAQGVIMYTTDGYMTAIVRTAQRSLPTAAPDDGQKAAAYGTYFNYAGTWSVEGDAVTHRIEHALDPNLVGAVMTRAIVHEGDRMVFTGVMADGKTKNVIIWRRR